MEQKTGNLNPSAHLLADNDLEKSVEKKQMMLTVSITPFLTLKK